MYRVAHNQQTMKQRVQDQHPSVSPCAQHLQYINILDKCSQIFREDRIWLRNQIKASNQSVIQIFKTSKKPFNLQHLQIRLRKYVTSIKSKAKMEQLNKFKENLSLCGIVPNPIKKNQKQIYHKSKNQSFSSTLTLKNILKQSYWKSNQRNQSFNARKNQTSYSGKSPKSQSVNNYSKKLLDRIKKEPYQKCKQRQPFSQQCMSNHMKPYCESKAQKNPLRQWQKEVISQKQAYQFRNPEFQAGNYGKYQQINQKEDKYFESQPNYQLSCEKERQESINNQYFEQQKKQQFRNKQIVSNVVRSENPVFQSNLWPKNNQNSIFTPPQLLNQCKRFLQQQKSVSGKKNHLQDLQIRKSEKDSFFRLENNQNSRCQNLDNELQQYTYAEPQTQSQLMQNYSAEKDWNKNQKPQNLNNQGRTQFKNLSDLPLNQPYNQFGSIEQPHFQHMNFSSQSNERYSNLYNYESSHLNQQATKQSNSNQNNGQLSFRQIYQRYSNNFNQHHQNQYEEPQSQEKQKQTLQNGEFQKYRNTRHCYCIQEVLDVLIPHFQGTNIRQQDFVNFLPDQLSDQMEIQFQSEQNEWLNVLDVVNCLATSFGLEKSSESNPAKDVYTLLDIDQKGFISLGDIEGFLTQLEEAGIECLQELSAKLWKLYENSEEDGKLEYWTMYLLKDDQHFNEVCGMLQQFQFEVQL